jgi:hypothetical protein
MALTAGPAVRGNYHAGKENSSFAATLSLVFLFTMFKPFLCAAGAIAATAGAGVCGSLYVNPEVNVGVGADTGLGGAIGEMHVGYEFDNGAYIQAGPAALVPKVGKTEIEWSGKAGIGSGPLYGEVSFITGDEVTFGVKAGAKFQL